MAGYGELRVSADAEALARDAAELICRTALDVAGPVRIALSGGSTPRRTYEVLAGSPLRERMPWDRVHWFWGDERFVPPDHKDSNYRMTREAMLDHVPAPDANVHPVPTVGLDAAEAARRYEATLRQAYGADRLEPGRPLFHLCLLGLGDDGHTASLIPGEPVLEETTRWVAEVGHGRPEVRITLTYPAIDQSAVIAFLVAGAGKRAVLEDVLTGHSHVPAARLHPTGQLLFLADRAAAASQA
jgi:6-phosphogluconolactonase